MSTTSQAGAIVFRTDNGVPRILLVRAKQDPTKWIFPKGHLEENESHAAAALREAYEEAGIRGVAVGLVGPSLTFQSKNELVAVEYYLVQMLTEAASLEGRQTQWFAPADALDALAFEDARDLLRSALLHLGRTFAGDSFDELILREYDHVAASFLANEESGEKRVTAFIAVCGAIGTALGFVVSRTDFALPERVLVAVTVLVLLLFGYVTFVRVIARNASSDRYKNQLSRIRQYFLSGAQDPRVAYLAFYPFERTRPRTEGKTHWHIGKGGWAETVALIEALLAGALISFGTWIALEVTQVWMFATSIALGIGGACLVWVVLFRRAAAIYHAELQDGRDGSVPLRGGGGALSAAVVSRGP